MRLLNTRTGEFKWIEDPRQVHYATLSHVWARSGDDGYPEQTYEDLLKLQKEDSSRPPNTLPSNLCNKLRCFCETAWKDGFEFGWADTCCIDKTSSSELSEAINSMYSWYAYSGACYAFLRDVESRSASLQWKVTFRRSEWFRRGWTLQELIAPRVVIFVFSGLNGDWEVLGSKHGLAACISEETGIDVGVLTLEESDLETIPIARRMSWMQTRETTRVEDEAYCLMGIFSVSMQTNYGEGRYAFIRLQEKILLQSTDQTIFAWGRYLDNTASQDNLLTFDTLGSSTTNAVSRLRDPAGHDVDPIVTVASTPFLKQYLLAPSPKDFGRDHSSTIRYLPRETFQAVLGIPGPIIEDLCQVFDSTPYGIRTHFPLLNVSSPDSHPSAITHGAILACEDSEKGVLVLLMRPRKNLTGNEFFAGAFIKGPIGGRPVPGSGAANGTREPVGDQYYRLAYITPGKIKALCTGTNSVFASYRPQLLSAVYIPRSASRSDLEKDRDTSIHAMLQEVSDRFRVAFCPWAQKILKQEGYHVDFHRLTHGDSHRDTSGAIVFASSESLLRDRPSSSRNENSVTISNDSGVYLTVRVDRCDCEMRKKGILRVLVSSLDPQALDGKWSISDHHDKAGIIHIQSWTFKNVYAVRDIEFDCPSNPSRRLSLRLTITSELSPVSDSSGSESPSQGTPQSVQHTIRQYWIGAELREREASELLGPPLPLPLNRPAYQQMAAVQDSHSAPSQPSHYQSLQTPHSVQNPGPSHTQQAPSLPAPSQPQSGPSPGPETQQPPTQHLPIQPAPAPSESQTQLPATQRLARDPVQVPPSRPSQPTQAQLPRPTVQSPPIESSPNQTPPNEPSQGSTQANQLEELAERSHEPPASPPRPPPLALEEPLPVEPRQTLSSEEKYHIDKTFVHAVGYIMFGGLLGGLLFSFISSNRFFAP